MLFLEDEVSAPSAVKNRGKADSKGDSKELYRNFDIIFEITLCAILDGTGSRSRSTVVNLKIEPVRGGGWLTVLYCTILYCTVLYYAVLYYTILYYIVLYYTMLYCTVLYCTVLYCTILA